MAKNKPQINYKNKTQMLRNITTKKTNNQGLEIVK